MMTFKTKYATYANCWFNTGRYNNGNLALSVESRNEGPICTCTVNPGAIVTHNAIAVKNYSENEGMVEVLTEMGIIGRELYRIPSVWVDIPVHELTAKGLELFEVKA